MRAGTLPAQQPPSLCTWFAHNVLENNLHFQQTPRGGTYPSKGAAAAAHPKVTFRRIGLFLWLQRCRVLVSEGCEISLYLQPRPHNTTLHKQIPERGAGTIMENYLKCAFDAKLLPTNIWSSCQLHPCLLLAACALDYSCEWSHGMNGRSVLLILPLLWANLLNPFLNRQCNKTPPFLLPASQLVSTKVNQNSQSATGLYSKCFD